jgi:hypothetical protein
LFEQFRKIHDVAYVVTLLYVLFHMIKCEKTHNIPHKLHLRKPLHVEFAANRRARVTSRPATYFVKNNLWTKQVQSTWTNSTNLVKLPKQVYYSKKSSALFKFLQLGEFIQGKLFRNKKINVLNISNYRAG